MTEAAHQMASNPLPPRDRKPGSVGLPAGPDIAVMAPDGRILPSGETGEIVIRGQNVTGGYEDNPAANAEAFRDGWFRTGDQGWIDADGYLRLTGRLKELINRGGEKISPREVDEVLLAHPAVRQAVCFAVAHAQLGEEIGAAVEVRASASVTGLRAAGVGRRAPAGIQGAARDSLPRRDPEGTDRQASARRVGDPARHRAARRSSRRRRARAAAVGRGKGHRRGLGGDVSRATHRREDTFRSARRGLAAGGAHARRGQRAAGARRAVPRVCRGRDHRGACSGA